MASFYKAFFTHPDFNIPCVATYDVEGECVLFDYQDYDSVVADYPEEKVNAMQKWLLSSGFNCFSLEQAYNELNFIGVSNKTTFDEAEEE